MGAADANSEPTYVQQGLFTLTHLPVLCCILLYRGELLSPGWTVVELELMSLLPQPPSAGITGV